jgi:hypothetical protein
MSDPHPVRPAHFSIEQRTHYSAGYLESFATPRAARAFQWLPGQATLRTTILLVSAHRSEPTVRHLANASRPPRPTHFQPVPAHPDSQQQLSLSQLQENQPQRNVALRADDATTVHSCSLANKFFGDAGRRPTKCNTQPGSPQHTATRNYGKPELTRSTGRTYTPPRAICHGQTLHGRRSPTQCRDRASGSSRSI